MTDPPIPLRPPPDIIPSADSRVWASAFIRAARENPQLLEDEAAIEWWFRNAIAAGFIASQQNRKAGQ